MKKKRHIPFLRFSFSQTDLHLVGDSGKYYPIAPIKTTGSVFVCDFDHGNNLSFEYCKKTMVKLISVNPKLSREQFSLTLGLAETFMISCFVGYGRMKPGQVCRRVWSRKIIHLVLPDNPNHVLEIEPISSDADKFVFIVEGHPGTYFWENERDDASFSFGKDKPNLNTDEFNSLSQLADSFILTCRHGLRQKYNPQLSLVFEPEYLPP